jgi:hypothetical protein
MGGGREGEARQRHRAAGLEVPQRQHEPRRARGNRYHVGDAEAFSHPIFELAYQRFVGEDASVVRGPEAGSDGVERRRVRTGEGKAIGERGRPAERCRKPHAAAVRSSRVGRSRS